MHQLTLQGVTYNYDALQLLCQQQLTNTNLPKWQQRIYLFIKAWIDDATIQVKTSGSTGTPKTINISRAQMQHSAMLTGRYLGLKQDDTALLCLNAEYIGGKMMIARAFTLGLNLLIAEPTGNPLEDIPNDTVINFAAMVPYQIKALIGMSNARLNDRIGRINHVILGGAPVSQQLKDMLIGFPNNIYETFGMTETVSHIALKRLSGGNVNNQFETLDTLVILGQDERDCLVVIAPELNPQPIITNDVVTLHDERHFTWLGRVDNVINSGGIKILAEALELQLAPFIEQRFFVAPKPDLELGQKLILVIESAPFTAVEETKLLLELRKHLGRYEVPKEINYLTAFIEAANHKINRKETLAAIGVIA